MEYPQHLARLLQGHNFAKLLAVAILLWAFATTVGCERDREKYPVAEPRNQEMSRTSLHMGTFVQVKVRGTDTEKLELALDAGFAEVARVEELMSAYRSGSDVARINEAAGGAAVTVDPEVFDVLERSVEISRATGGAFDITAAGMKGLWSIDPEAPRAATEAEIKERLPLIGHDKFRLDGEKREASLVREGMRIDLGGIAKGYAADRAIEAIKGAGVRSAMVNCGGDLRFIAEDGERPWRVGIQHPRDGEGFLGVIEGHNMSVATSGDYEKYIVIEGKRYCHILDPRTGRPADKSQAVTVVTDECWRADALATGLFVLGPEDGTKAVGEMEGVRAIFVDGAGRLSGATELIKKE